MAGESENAIIFSGTSQRRINGQTSIQGQTEWPATGKNIVNKTRDKIHYGVQTNALKAWKFHHVTRLTNICNGTNCATNSTVVTQTVICQSQIQQQNDKIRFQSTQNDKKC